MKSKILWITRTAIFTALLVTLQYVTKPMSQLVTGSCVNFILALAALTSGYWSGFTVAAISPFFALLFGIAPPIIWFTPMIALGNIVLVTILWLIANKAAKKYSLKNIFISAGGAIVSAGAKFAALWLGIVVILVPLLNLPQAQAAKFTTMFTWPQLFTALIGTGIAIFVAPIVKKAINSK
ncbi:MAG: ECF transporter S component [Clostridiales bacterium]|nr:ECF transporter S component [Clostridiales bacterium]